MLFYLKTPTIRTKNLTLPQPTPAWRYPGSSFSHYQLGASVALSNRAQGRTIRVVGAAIINDGKILCARRGETRSLAGLWEFPGGKIEAYETPGEALQREIEEELQCAIEVGAKVCTTTYAYAFGRVELTTFICNLVSGHPTLTEHSEMQWVSPRNLTNLNWAPADREAVNLLVAEQNEQNED